MGVVKLLVLAMDDLSVNGMARLGESLIVFWLFILRPCFLLKLSLIYALAVNRRGACLASV